MDVQLGIDWVAIELLHTRNELEVKFLPADEGKSRNHGDDCALDRYLWLGGLD